MVHFISLNIFCTTTWVNQFTLCILNTVHILLIIEKEYMFIYLNLKHILHFIAHMCSRRSPWFLHIKPILALFHVLILKFTYVGGSFCPNFHFQLFRLTYVYRVNLLLLWHIWIIWTCFYFNSVTYVGGSFCPNFRS